MFSDKLTLWEVHTENNALIRVMMWLFLQVPDLQMVTTTRLLQNTMICFVGKKGAPGRYCCRNSKQFQEINVMREIC